MILPSVCQQETTIRDFTLYPAGVCPDCGQGPCQTASRKIVPTTFGPCVNVGDVVLYSLSMDDTRAINARRSYLIEHPSPADPHPNHEESTPGERHPLIVTQIDDPDTGRLAGTVMLIGGDFWAVSQVERGDGTGCWAERRKP